MLLITRTQSVEIRTKLDCKSGHWGTFIDYGLGRAWLRNNISGSDCRTMRQLQAMKVLADSVGLSE